MVILAACNSGFQTREQSAISVDTLIDRATDLYEAGHGDAAIKYFDSAFTNKDDITIRDKFYYYHYLYEVNRNMGRSAPERKYIDSMVYVIENADEEDTMADEYAMANFAKADYLLQDKHYNEAYQYYYRAKASAQRNNDSCALSHYVYKIGIVLYRAERYGKAIPYFREAYTLFNNCEKNITAVNRLQEITDNIGLCYAKEGYYDTAIAFYDSALSIAHRFRDSFPATKNRLFDMAEAVARGNKGAAYFALGKKDIAEKEMLASIAINMQKDYDNQDAQLTRIRLADLYLTQNKFDKALQLLDRVRSWQDSNYSQKVALRWNNIMWQYWARQHNDSKAFTYLLRYKTLTDSLDEAEKKLRFIDIDEKVKGLEKQNQINVLQKQDETKKLYLVIAVFLCVTAVSVSFLVYKNYRESKENVRKLQELNDQIVEQKSILQKALDDVAKVGKEKDRILKAVSHDMRSPVNSAMALIDLLLMEKDNLTEDQLAYLNLMRDSCSNALSLTTDLLEVATLSDEKLFKSPVDINALIRNAIELLRFKAAEKNQAIEVNVADEPFAININREKIARVINNLVNNAMKFSPSGSEILVSGSPAADGYNITVKDQGIGIPAEIQDKVFDIFTEAKRFGTSGEQPYGLGLSITRQIVEVHHGRIWFESEPGHGTTFHVFLPLA